jgi:hypothetical protein
MNGLHPPLTIKEFRELIGPDKIGRDLAYELARRFGFRLGKRLLIPRHVAEAIIEGRLQDLEQELKERGRSPKGAA